MCVIGVAWAAFEIGSSIFDGYSTISTLNDPCATPGEKWLTTGLFAAGLILPGGGGATGFKVPKRLLPFRDSGRILEINKTLDRIESGGPFPYGRDGIIFRNTLGKLPGKPQGYCREYNRKYAGLFLTEA